MKRLNYSIKGMSCAACVAHVERAIKNCVGEKDSFSVSLLTNSVSVMLEKEIEGNELKALEERLAASVKAAGYTLLLEAPKEEKKGISEFQKNIYKLIASAIFTLAIMYLSMGSMVGLPIPAFLKKNALSMALAQLILTLPVLVINFKFFRNGFNALIHLAPNMDSLIAVGSGASVIYGLIAVFMIANAKDVQQIHSWLHDLYFESAAMILTLVSLGKLLESRAKDKAADAVRSLATLSPKYATVLRNGIQSSILVEEIVQGDLILIRAGELIPVDGVVVSGSGSTDESALTGESMPVEKQIDSPVRAACVLTSGALTVKAEQVGENTSLSRIIRLLEDAAASKAPIARIADKVSAVFVPAVMAISLVTFVCWMLLTTHFEQALRSAIAVLVISCPCALGLATPTAITVGIGRGAKMGILFRNAEALEKLCGVKTIVFDKTGTITEGKPSLTDIYAYKTDPEKLLRFAAAVENMSSHPLAQAVVRTAEKAFEEALPKALEFVSLTGIGAEASVEGICCRVGKPDINAWENLQSDAKNTEQKEEKDLPFSNLFNANVYRKTDSSSARADFERLESEGKTAVLVTLDGEIAGVFGISDRIREDSPMAVNTLKNAGVKCLMLTGDNQQTAAFVAQKANLDGFYASLMPEDKERMVRELCERDACAMVGDGINDAPALVRADVGIAIGAGTEVAIDCAGVVLSGNSLVGVADAYMLSRASIRIIKQNLFWALFYNAICIPVAAGVFYPIFSWQLSPMLASAAMSCSSVFVVLNALRLRRIQFHYIKGEKEMLFGKKNVVTHEIGVEGMMCVRCVAHVKEALSAVKGVQNVEVSLEEKKATVVAEEKVSLDLLKAAITKAGYQII
jgi:Cu+-exporting ATPase